MDIDCLSRTFSSEEKQEKLGHWLFIKDTDTRALPASGSAFFHASNRRYHVLAVLFLNIFHLESKKRPICFAGSRISRTFALANENKGVEPYSKA